MVRINLVCTILFLLKITKNTMEQNIDSSKNEKPNSNLTEREIIEALWSLLDDIDTLSDICKPTLENPKTAMAFYNNAIRYAKERFKYMQSDGYKIYTYDEFKLLKTDKPEYKSIPRDNTK